MGRSANQEVIRRFLWNRADCDVRSKQRGSLISLRLAADCSNVAADVPEADLRAHFLRMAGMWT